MKTVVIILFVFALGGIANAQLVRKTGMVPKTVHVMHSGNRRCDKHPVIRKHLHQHPARLNRTDIKYIPVERKEK